MSTPTDTTVPIPMMDLAAMARWHQAKPQEQQEATIKRIEKKLTK